MHEARKSLNFECILCSFQHLDQIEYDNYYVHYEDKFLDGHKIFCYTLHIQNITIYDNGTYVCEVFNAAGKFNSSTHIDVLGM